MGRESSRAGCSEQHCTSVRENTTGESAAVERIESDGGGAQALRDEEEGCLQGRCLK